MRKPAAIALLSLLLCLISCVSPESARIRKYFTAVVPFEEQLQALQTQFKQVQGLPVEARKEAYQHLVETIRGQIASLRGVETPPEAARYQELLVQLHEHFASFADKASATIGVINPEEVKKITAERDAIQKQYADTLTQLQAEQKRLTETYKVKFD